MPVQRKRLLDDLLELIRIPSPSLHEVHVASVIRTKLQEIGLKSEVDDAAQAIGGEQGNIIARLPGNVDSPTLMLNAHMDTVTPCENVNPIVEGDYVRSDGSTILGSDDKAGVCIILELLRVLSEDGVMHGPLEIVFTVAEEIGLLGAQHLDYERLSARVAFVFDGGVPINRVVIAAPSQKNIKVLVHGRAAHAGVAPEKGINAIVLASRAIAKMKLGRIDEETTANIGIVRGGRATNIVPDLVEVQGEARSHSEDKLNAQIEHMRRLFIEEAEGAHGSAEVEVMRKYRAFHVKTDELPARVAQLALEKLDMEPKWEKGGGGSDANIFNEHGIRSIIVSSAEQNPHTLSECINIIDMERATQFAIELVRTFAELTSHG